MFELAVGFLVGLIGGFGLSFARRQATTFWASRSRKLMLATAISSRSASDPTYAVTAVQAAALGEMSSGHIEVVGKSSVSADAQVDWLVIEAIAGEGIIITLLVRPRPGSEFPPSFRARGFARAGTAESPLFVGASFGRHDKLTVELRSAIHGPDPVTEVVVQEFFDPIASGRPIMGPWRLSLQDEPTTDQGARLG